MPFAEDIAAFFSAADFAWVAVWTPRGGSQAKQVNVIVDMPDQVVGAFKQDAINTGYRILFATEDMPNLAKDEMLTINATQYQVHEAPLKVSDGKISEATLVKVR